MNKIDRLTIDELAATMFLFNWKTREEEFVVWLFRKG